MQMYVYIYVSDTYTKPKTRRGVEALYSLTVVKLTAAPCTAAGPDSRSDSRSSVGCGNVAAAILVGNLAEQEWWFLLSGEEQSALCRKSLEIIRKQEGENHCRDIARPCGEASHHNLPNRLNNLQQKWRALMWSRVSSEQGVSVASNPDYA